MTRVRAKELLPVLQAWAEGKDIQIFDCQSDRWEDYFKAFPDFNNLAWKWRVKPEPREFWLARGIVCRNEEECKNLLECYKDISSEIIHVKEIL